MSDTVGRSLRGAFLVMLFLGACAQPSAGAGTITASGFVEGQSYRLATELQGQVVQVLADEGSRVAEGEPLLRIQTPEMEAARAGAEAELAAALADLERLERRPTEVEVALAEASLRQAEADLESAQGALDQLEISYLPGEPPALELVFAQGEVEIAQAQKALREAELEEVRAGPREHELEIAEAMVEKARARLEQVELRRERSVLRAPIDGRVNQLFIKRGETATQGMTLVEMLDVDNLVLRVYLPEERVASIQVGHPVTIEVDAYPGKAFEGVVRWIADEAQFTPTDVQTREQRVKLVFAVDIQLHDPEGELRIGMPADASFSN